MTTQSNSVAEQDRSLEDIEADIKKNLEGTGYVLSGFGANSVGVQGDARIVGPTVILIPPSDCTTETAGKISTDLINNVKGITRVMIDIPITPA